MTPNEYHDAALRTAHTDKSAWFDQAHATLGLSTEIGEFTTEVKRLVIYGRELTDEATAHMYEELGDVLWYMPLAARAFGRTFGDVARFADGLNDLPEGATLAESLSIVSREMCAAAGYYCAEVPLVEGAVVRSPTVRLAYLARILKAVGTAARLLGTDSESLAVRNIEKLLKRYPDRFTEELAEARLDKGGADSRSS